MKPVASQGLGFLKAARIQRLGVPFCFGGLFFCNLMKQLLLIPHALHKRTVKSPTRSTPSW